VGERMSHSVMVEERDDVWRSLPDAVAVDRCCQCTVAAAGAASVPHPSLRPIAACHPHHYQGD